MGSSGPTYGNMCDRSELLCITLDTCCESYPQSKSDATDVIISICRQHTQANMSTAGRSTDGK